MDIKFVDLTRIHQPLSAQIDQIVNSIVSRNEYVGGEYVEQFESNFASYLGAENCISCANGTDALELALWALDIKSGDEVIVPAHSWISTASAVVSVGAIPIFVSCRPDDYTIDTQKIEQKISAKTKAIIAVHLYGHPADMDAINEISQIHGLKVIEDAAQAHGAEYKNKKCGTLADVACFSFYPSKNLGSLGDAGCVVTNNKNLSDKIRAYKNCGQAAKNNHIYWGRNSRMDNLQAAILNLKIPFLDQWNEERRLIAAYYSEHIDDSKYDLPIEKPNAKHVYHIYCIRTSRRTEVIAILNEAGIEYGIHYPRLLPNIFDQSKSIFDESDYTDNIISIPMYPGLTQNEMGKIVDVLNMQ